MGVGTAKTIPDIVLCAICLKPKLLLTVDLNPTKCNICQPQNTSNHIIQYKKITLEVIS